MNETAFKVDLNTVPAFVSLGETSAYDSVGSNWTMNDIDVRIDMGLMEKLNLPRPVVDFTTKNYMSCMVPKIDRVVFNNPATIVFFKDGTKVTVKTSDQDTFNKEHGILYAIFKRIYGVVDNDTGIVESNGCGIWLKRLAEKAFDQTTVTKKAKKDNKQTTKVKKDNKQTTKVKKVTAKKSK